MQQPRSCSASPQRIKDAIYTAITMYIDNVIVYICTFRLPKIGNFLSYMQLQVDMRCTYEAFRHAVSEVPMLKVVYRLACTTICSGKSQVVLHVNVASDLDRQANQVCPALYCAFLLHCPNAKREN